MLACRQGCVEYTIGLSHGLILGLGIAVNNSRGGCLPAPLLSTYIEYLSFCMLGQWIQHANSPRQLLGQYLGPTHPDQSNSSSSLLSRIINHIQRLAPN